MESKKQKLYNILPTYFKNILVTLYNLKQIKIHGTRYRVLKEKYEDIFFTYKKIELMEVQNERFLSLIKFARTKNLYYRDLLNNIDINSIDDLKKIPILSKKDLNNETIRSMIDDPLINRSTGGTTGKSLQFALTFDDVVEREANLDFFREMYDYKYKDRCAWFSGKKLITDGDVKKNIFWVQDYINNTTYYSTRHIQEDHIDYMIDHINKTQPEFFIGFPSAIYNIALRWKKSNKKKNIKLKAIFPTAETLLSHQKVFLTEFFNCPIPNQYASSEGAPFIYECKYGGLHFDMYSGILERRYNEEGNYEVLVTSFTTHYMPLIRYAIGDRIEMSPNDAKCKCGSNMPLVKEISGRSGSFIYTKEYGIVGSGSISDLAKYAQGIEKLQIIQDSLDKLTVNIVCDRPEEILESLEYELRERVGDEIKIEFKFLEDIPLERSGKYLMIKNNFSLEDLKN